MSPKILSPSPSDRTMTPSTLKAPTMSGLVSLTGTEKSLVPTKVKPGNFDKGMSNAGEPISGQELEEP